MSNKIDSIAIPIYNNKRDGQGRDCYIGNDNGSNTFMYNPTAKGNSDGTDPTYALRHKLGAHGHLSHMSVT